MTRATPHPATSTPHADGPPRRLKMIFILGSLTAVAPLSIDMYLPALPQLTEDLSTDAVRTQLTLTACVVGLAVGQAIAGPLSDSLGRRRPLLIGTFAYAVASLLCALAPNVETLIALRVVQGAAGSAGIVIARAIVRDRYDGVAAARFFSLLVLVTGLAPILAPVFGGQLLRFMPWPGVFAVLAALGAVMFAAALLGQEETLPVGSRASGGVRSTLRTFGELLTDRVFVGYALGIGLSFGAMFTYISGSSFVLQNLYGMSPQGFSFAFGSNAIGLVIASQTAGRLAGRVPLRRLLAVGLFLAIVGGVVFLAGALAGGGLPVVLPALFLVATANGIILPQITALAMEGRPPRTAGSASALMGVAQFALGGAAAPLAGIGGPGTAVPMAAAIAVLATLATVSAMVVARP